MQSAFSQAGFLCSRPSSVHAALLLWQPYHQLLILSAAQCASGWRRWPLLQPHQKPSHRSGAGCSITRFWGCLCSTSLLTARLHGQRCAVALPCFACMLPHHFGCFCACLLLHVSLHHPPAWPAMPVDPYLPFYQPSLGFLSWTALVQRSSDHEKLDSLLVCFRASGPLASVGQLRPGVSHVFHQTCASSERSNRPEHYIAELKTCSLRPQSLACIWSDPQHDASLSVADTVYCAVHL